MLGNLPKRGAACMICRDRAEERARLAQSWPSPAEFGALVDSACRLGASGALCAQQWCGLLERRPCPLPGANHVAASQKDDVWYL